MVQRFSSVARRSFLSRLGLGAAAIGAGAAAILPKDAQAAAATGFTPQRHAEDDWLDAPKGGHRTVIDSSSIDGGAAALLYAGNYFASNKAGYNLDTPAIAVVVVFRHLSTPIGYTDAIWAKYGEAFSELGNFKDPKTKAAPKTNLFNSAEYGLTLPNFGTTLPSLVEKNVQFAVCNMATRFISGAIADKTKGNADAIYRELSTSLIPNARLVASGVLGVNRAQERGYTFLYAG